MKAFNDELQAFQDSFRHLDLPADFQREMECDERLSIGRLLKHHPDDSTTMAEIQLRADRLLASMRRQPARTFDRWLSEYSLDTEEGVILLCLAESLVRIPDQATALTLLHSYLSEGDWISHLGHSRSLFVNASTWGLLLSGDWLAGWKPEKAGHQLRSLRQKLGDAALHKAISEAVRQMGRHFVCGESIEAAVDASMEMQNQGYRQSFDMLGEAAMTREDANRYLQQYLRAIDYLGNHQALFRGRQPAVSVKLSALHPRYELRKLPTVLPQLTQSLLQLLDLADRHQVALTLDAEESVRLELSLLLLDELLRARLTQTPGLLGIAVQAYQPRALPLLHWLNARAAQYGQSLHVRLVKGAYWDSEIRYAQLQGWTGYPVYTSKAHTDLSYLCCAKTLLRECHALHPQFATHNAQTLAAVLTYAEASQRRDFECQRLFGMGEALYDPLLQQMPDLAVSVYTPTGPYRELLPYLVRRLLENGVNNSFLKQFHADQNAAQLVQHPATLAQAQASPELISPNRILHNRVCAPTLNLDNSHDALAAWHMLALDKDNLWQAWPLVGAGSAKTEHSSPCLEPADSQRCLGEVYWAGEPELQQALAAAQAAFPAWQHTPVAQRAQCLEHCADLFWDHRDDLLSLLVREAGKTLPDALAELREAIDFCRYYAQLARAKLGKPRRLAGPTGERNEWLLEGRGVCACISPWNFPLAIFTGQIVAALVCGNTVLAKPASATPLIGYQAVQLMLQAGIPKDVLHYLPAPAELFSQHLLKDSRVKLVALTGAAETAFRINRLLAEREDSIVPLIAETGGQNAMILDSTAHLEQSVKDVLVSAFTSAGQRCSALRVIYVQRDVAEPFRRLLQGAMDCLNLGPGALPSTDVGPLISATAAAQVRKHIEHWRRRDAAVYQTPLPRQLQDLPHSAYVAPTLIEIAHLGDLDEEVFGPVLHLIEYAAEDLDAVIRQIQDSGYGLTFGLQTRIPARMRELAEKIPAGNIYINRSMIGATVGGQPFGGRGLSGTGPKAGGPQYLDRFLIEKTISHFTAAIGGNMALFNRQED